jgi:hypothetical protein
MQVQVRCQECHRLVSCEELRLGAGGRKLCCDCHTETIRSPRLQSRPDWRKAEEAEVAVALGELPPSKAEPELADAAAEPL